MKNKLLLGLVIAGTLSSAAQAQTISFKLEEDLIKMYRNSEMYDTPEIGLMCYLVAFWIKSTNDAWAAGEIKFDEEDHDYIQRMHHMMAEIFYRHSGEIEDQMD